MLCAKEVELKMGFQRQKRFHKELLLLLLPMRYTQSGKNVLSCSSLPNNN